MYIPLVTGGELGLKMHGLFKAAHPNQLLYSGKDDHQFSNFHYSFIYVWTQEVEVNPVRNE